MDKIEAQVRIDRLKATLRENSRRYYVDNAPVISDLEYDLMMKELEALEAEYPEFLTQDSPTQKVGSDIDAPVGKNAESESRSNFVKRAHRYPMPSSSRTMT